MTERPPVPADRAPDGSGRGGRAGRPAGRRSGATRAAILRAARARFAADGYRSATVRAIAADAGIDPSMVVRYYGSKAELFAAATDLDLRLPDLSSVPRARLGVTLVRHFLNRWEGDPADDALLMLLRSAATDDVAAEQLRDLFTGQVVPLARAASGDDRDAQRRAGLVASQLLGLALTRHVLRLPGIADADRDQVALAVGPTIQRYLTGAVRG